jgi:general secretion pathway protein E
MAIAAQESPTKFGEGIIASYPDPLRTCVWNAIIEKATDVHLHCVAEGLRVLHRVDGIIHPKETLPPADGRKLLNQLKTASGLNFTRTFIPLEGQLIWPDADMRWEIRVTLTPIRDHESAHLRLLSMPRDEWDIANLGFNATDQEKVSAAVRGLNGMILVTGATGSGKTTTMYCLASLMDLRTTTTYSIEDPVEFRLPYVQQIEVDERHGLTMHEGLRTILRMDPDLILVGEIRDGDSAMVAARAALSGRLVLATIHAQDAAGAVDALHYLGVPSSRHRKLGPSDHRPEPRPAALSRLRRAPPPGPPGARVVRPVEDRCPREPPGGRRLPRLPQLRVHGAHRHLRGRRGG